MPASPTLLLTLAWITGFTLIDSSIVSLALPDVALDFGATVAELAWVSTGFLLALTASLLAAGALSDRLGQRRVLLAGAAAFLLTTAACGAAPTFDLLIVARVLQGAAGGVLYTISLAIATTAYPPERRASALAIYFTSGALGAVLGPVVGGLLTDIGGWRLVFFAQLPLPLAIIGLALVALPASKPSPRAVDAPGIAAASLFIVAATYAMLELPSLTDGPAVAIAAVVAVVALIAFVARERTAPDPAVRLPVFRNVRFVVGSVSGAAAWFAIMASTIYPAIYLQLGRGFAATDAGLLLLPAPLVGLIFFPIAGRLVGHLTVDRALPLGLVLLVASGFAMLTWGAATPLWAILATNVLTGLGIAVTLVASATGALAQFAPSEVGTGSALFNSLRQLGAALGVALPAVAFDLAAGGGRDPGAVLEGSTAAFLLRLAVLSIPLIVVFVTAWGPRAAARAAAPSVN